MNDRLRTGRTDGKDQTRTAALVISAWLESAADDGDPQFRARVTATLDAELGLETIEVFADVDAVSATVADWLRAFIQAP